MHAIDQLAIEEGITIMSSDVLPDIELGLLRNHGDNGRLTCRGYSFSRYTHVGVPRSRQEIIREGSMDIFASKGLKDCGEEMWCKRR